MHKIHSLLRNRFTLAIISGTLATIISCIFSYSIHISTPEIRINALVKKALRAGRNNDEETMIDFYTELLNDEELTEEQKYQFFLRLGKAYFKNKEYEYALECFQSTNTIALSNNNIYKQILSQERLATVWCQWGTSRQEFLDYAEGALAHAIKLAKKMDIPDLESYLHLRMASLKLLQGNLAEAENNLVKATYRGGGLDIYKSWQYYKLYAMRHDKNNMHEAYTTILRLMRPIQTGSQGYVLARNMVAYNHINEVIFFLRKHPYYFFPNQLGHSKFDIYNMCIKYAEYRAKNCPADKFDIMLDANLETKIFYLLVNETIFTVPPGGMEYYLPAGETNQISLNEIDQQHQHKVEGILRIISLYIEDEKPKPTIRDFGR